MLEPDGHTREPESPRGQSPLGRAFRRMAGSCVVTPLLVALLLAFATGCGGAATDSTAAPTEASTATSTPTAAVETPPTVTTPLAPAQTPAAANADATPSATPAGSPEATETPGAPAGTPTAVKTPVAPAETPTAVALSTTQPPALSPTPVTPTATATALPTETPAPIQGPVVRIGDALFPVDLALTPEQRSQGLSGREVMAAETGMLFIFENEGTFSFWMKEMHFPLDIVWIGADCTVVDVTLGAPPPEEGQALADLPRFSPSSPALYVLELNAGEFAEQGIDPGDLVEFVGDLEGLHGC